MTEGQAVETPKKRKGMLGFYIGLGAVALLLVGFYFSWTPLRVWYWEREVRRSPSGNNFRVEWPDWPITSMGPRGEAARRLVDIGPVARFAVRRLLAEKDFELRLDVVVAFRKEEHAWGVPLLVEAGSDERIENLMIAEYAIMATGHICGQQFFPVTRNIMDEGSEFQIARVQEGRKALRVWWEKEGKAKYGRGVE